MALLTPRFRASGLQNCEGINVPCLKPAGVTWLQQPEETLTRRYKNPVSGCKLQRATEALKGSCTSVVGRRMAVRASVAGAWQARGTPERRSEQTRSHFVTAQPAGPPVPTLLHSASSPNGPRMLYF